MRLKKPKATTHYDAVQGSSVRALYQGAAGAMHKIEFTFLLDNGEQVVITMEHQAAADLLESGIHAYTAIQRPLRQAIRTPFGG